MDRPLDYVHDSKCKRISESRFEFVIKSIVNLRQAVIRSNTFNSLGHVSSVHAYTPSSVCHGDGVSLYIKLPCTNLIEFASLSGKDVFCSFTSFRELFIM